LAEIYNFFKIKGIKDRYKIKHAYKIIEVIGQGDEEIFFFRNLEKEGDSKEKGQDDETSQHQTLHIFKHYSMRFNGKIRIRIHPISPPVLIRGENIILWQMPFGISANTLK
jgi:hypothetical protein